jgi:hypothetical protein
MKEDVYNSQKSEVVCECVRCVWVGSWTMGMDERMNG